MDYTRFDLDKLGPRSLAAYRVLIDPGQLLDGSNIWDKGWHDWQDVIAAMLAGSDLTPKSCSDILRGLEYNGEVLRRGAFSPGKDRRQVRFIDTSPPLEPEDYGPDEMATRDRDVAEHAEMLKLKEQAMTEARERRR